jgi:transposase-like protein
MHDRKRILKTDDSEEADPCANAMVSCYYKPATRLADRLMDAISEASAVFEFLSAHRWWPRTERYSIEINRRAQVATLFPHEASLLRLVFAVLSESATTGAPNVFT